MSSLLIRQIRSLVLTDNSPEPAAGKAMHELPCIDEAFLLIENDRIADFGPMERCPDRADHIIEAPGRFVFPCWCDSHTHLVYAGSREQEFVDRIRGLSYEEIARRGGGILNSARRLGDTSEEDLFEQAYARLEEVQRQGTGVLEIKSGYGLSLEAELRMLRVVRRLRESSRLAIRATFLGAHALPLGFRQNREGYIRLIVEEMLPRIAEEGLADYIDVFCERQFFSPSETEVLLEAGARYGLKPKIHTNQFHSMGGIEAALKFDAVSVDHLEVLTEEEIQLLRQSKTIPTLLPSAPFFIGGHYPPARRMIDAGLAVALASDYNPGTAPSGKMAFVLTLACVKLRMTPAEAIQAATKNGAHALEWQQEYGTIARGKMASLFISRPMPSIDFLPYAFGSDLVEKVILQGKPL